MAKGKKTGGREEGTPNIITSQLRAVLKDVLHNEVQKLPEYLLELQPKERVELLVKLMPYVFPKVKEVDSYNGEPLGSGWNTY